MRERVQIGNDEGEYPDGHDEPDVRKDATVVLSKAGEEVELCFEIAIKIRVSEPRKTDLDGSMSETTSDRDSAALNGRCFGTETVPVVST